MDSAADATREAQPPARTDPPPDTCRNCGAHATGHFCPNCGQETRVALPTFMAFMREAAGRYVAMDGRMWRTLAALVARPGYLTREYLNGRRKRYIRPARLFLVLYLLLFAIIGLLQSPGDLSDEVVFADSDKAAEEIAKAGREIKEARKELRAGKKTESAPGKAADAEGDHVALVENDDGSTFIGLDKDNNVTVRMGGKDLDLPPHIKKRWEHFKKLSKEEKGERLYAGMLRYGPYAMAAMLPAFALLLKLAYLGRAGRYPGRPHRYAEHLVYSAHLHAFAAIMIIAVLLMPLGIAKFAIALWIVFYAMRARQLVYRGRWWGGLARALLIATAYSVILAFAIMGLLVLAIVLH